MVFSIHTLHDDPVLEGSDTYGFIVIDEELRDHEGNNIDDIALMEDVRELVDDFLDKNK